VTPPGDYERLCAVLERAQIQGALGARPIAEVIDHANDFVAALPTDVTSVLDLGTGAGIPGLVIAFARPSVQVTMVDRRAKRIDALQRAIVALGWEARATTIAVDAEQLIADPTWLWRHDAVVARGFADPRTTLRVAAQLTRTDGWVVISEPPAGSPTRWDPAWYEEFQVSRPERLGRVARFHVEHGHQPPPNVLRGTQDEPQANVPRGTVAGESANRTD